jgi:hypothetical protein
MVRSACKTAGERDLLQFTNFRRQLSLGSNNIFPLNKTHSKLISKYYFSRKKTYTNVYKSYKVGVLASRHANPSVDFLKQTCLLHTKDVKCRPISSLKNFNAVVDSRNIVILNSVKTLLNRYTTLKSGSNLKLYKLDNRRLMPVVKNLGRLSYRQYRYVKIFWNKIRNFLSRKNVRSRRKFFFRRKKVFRKNTIVVFNNSFSMYPLIPNSHIFKKFSNATGPVGLVFLVNSPRHIISKVNYVNEAMASGFFKNISDVPKTTHPLHSFSKTFIFNKHGSSFILFHNSVISPYRFRFKFDIKKSYRVRKLFYSFLKPNELKKSILDSRKKLIYNKVVTLLKSSKIVFKKLVFTHKNVLSLLRNGNAVGVGHGSLNSINSLGSYPGSFVLNAGTSSSNELRVPRVRFKPGYQRL